MTKLDEVKAELLKIESAVAELGKLKIEQKSLVDELNDGKKRLFEIKKVFDENVVFFVEAFLKLDSVQDEIKKVLVILGGDREAEIIPIEKFYGCVGTLDNQNRNFVISDDICPAVLGFQVFKLLRERRVKNGK